jgi:hypothetical protein
MLERSTKDKRYDAEALHRMIAVSPASFFQAESR